MLKKEVFFLNTMHTVKV